MTIFADNAHHLHELEEYIGILGDQKISDSLLYAKFGLVVLILPIDLDEQLRAILYG